MECDGKRVICDSWCSEYPPVAGRAQEKAKNVEITSSRAIGRQRIALKYNQVGQSEGEKVLVRRTQKDETVQIQNMSLSLALCQLVCNDRRHASIVPR